MMAMTTATTAMIDVQPATFRKLTKPKWIDTRVGIVVVCFTIQIKRIYKLIYHSYRETPLYTHLLLFSPSLRY